MKTVRHQDSTLTASAYSEKNEHYKNIYNNNLAKSDLLTKDLKATIDCIFNEFQGAITRSQKKCLHYYGGMTVGRVQFSLMSPGFFLRKHIITVLA